MRFGKLNQYLFLSLILFVLLGAAGAQAKTWNLDEGDIYITVDASGQSVSQNAVKEFDDAPVIAQQNGGATEKRIIIETEDGLAAKLSVQALHINTSAEAVSAIDLVGGAAAEITLIGENRIVGAQSSEGKEAAVHVGEGDLTLTGDGSLHICYDGSGAKIGSDEGEDMSGAIRIAGKVSVYTQDDRYADSAAIGSGQYADLVGSVRMEEEAHVVAHSNDRGAGIGVGEGGDFRGEVVISGNAVVVAVGDDDSAGIGSSKGGSFSGGRILIEGNARVEATGSGDGPGIGAANNQPLDGDIIIRGNAIVKVVGGSSAPDIGQEGNVGGGKGSISILENASVEKLNGEGGEPLVIGSEYSGEEGFAGAVTIGKDTQLNGEEGSAVVANGSQAVTLTAADSEKLILDASEATLEATPETTTEVPPEATPETTTEVTPEATPETTTEVPPETTPEMTLQPVETAAPVESVEVDYYPLPDPQPITGSSKEGKDGKDSKATKGEQVFSRVTSASGEAKEYTWGSGVVDENTKVLFVTPTFAQGESFSQRNLLMDSDWISISRAQGHTHVAFVLDECTVVLPLASLTDLSYVVRLAPIYEGENNEAEKVALADKALISGMYRVRITDDDGADVTDAIEGAIVCFDTASEQEARLCYVARAEDAQPALLAAVLRVASEQAYYWSELPGSGLVCLVK